MKYRNTRTGAVIETSGKISGDNWQEVTGKDNVRIAETTEPENEGELVKETLNEENMKQEETPKTADKAAPKKTVVKRATKK